ncbi:MAG: RNA methyltransferase [Dehalococcoidia bacterium]|nr:RNA methyltransferase [Dehalococcoidia bacterium]
MTEPPEGAPPLPAEEDAPAVFAAEEVGAAAPAPAPQKRSRSRRAAPEMPAAPEAAPAAEAPVSEVAPKSRSRKRRAEAAETAAPPPREESAAPTDVPPLSAVGDLAAAPERIDTAPPAPDLGAAAAERSARPVARPSEKEPIASLENERVRMVRSLHEKRHRDELGAFLIEGVRLVEEALSAGADIPLVLYDPEAVSRNSRARQLIDALGDVAIPVTDRVLRSVADTQTPQGIVGMVRVPEPAEAAPTGRLVLVLDAVQDPGNVGTILRAAVASGVNAVIIGPDCADVYSPKVVRAAMGAHFHLDLFTGLDWPQIDRMTAGRQRLVGAPVGGRVYYQVDWTRPTALIISNEAAGPSLGALRLAGGPGNGKVSIPIVGAADSLNAAVAAGVLLFEASRQVSERRGQQERGARHDRGQRPNLGRNTPFRDGPPQRDGGWRPGFDRHSGGRPFGGGQGSRPYPAGGAPRRPSDFDDEPPFRGGPPRGGRPGGGGRPSNPRPPYRGGGGRDR